MEQSLVIADERQEPISVELEDGDQITPRSSVDTVPSVIRDPYYMDTASSRRSSMDSLASINHPYHSARSSQLSAPRLSQFLLRSSSTPSLVKKTEHLLWGFAQVVGNFSVDPTLINNNEFAPLKRRTMYRPHGTGMGGGGGLLIGKPDRHAKIGKASHMIIFDKTFNLFSVHRYPDNACPFNPSFYTLCGPRFGSRRDKKV